MKLRGNFDVGNPKAYYGIKQIAAIVARGGLHAAIQTAVDTAGYPRLVAALRTFKKIRAAHEENSVVFKIAAIHRPSRFFPIIISLLFPCGKVSASNGDFVSRTAYRHRTRNYLCSERTGFW